ncbi:MAG: putative monovalent cation/H+ antiporter subunit A [Marivita sp.]|uniref:putative monovalent cation/H+ antiporter subunit A n=1 Tax=Marivita sp. TaxID=2003365 RepID=UPI003EF4FF2C
MAGGFPKDVNANGITGVIPILFAAALFVFFASMIPTIAAQEIIRVSVPWIPSLGIELAFLVDGLSLTFSLLISGIGTLVLLYSNTYLAGHPQYARFALFLTAFMVSMLGLVLADDLIVLFVFWELTTLTSYMLIGFSHEAEKSRRNALQALFVTGAGGLAFLAGLILLAAVSGTTSISGLLTMGDDLKAHAMYLPILILLLAGTFTKSAQVPFHFWLPNAMAAPTPVSAFLHSATMVKAGIYVMARMHPAMSGTDVWLWTLTALGAATAVFASLLALRQTDLKQALAYTTLMALGTLTLFLGQESGYAMTAFATFLIVHSLYKAALFLVVGCIDLSTGTRETDQLGGLRRLMPITTVAAALAALSMAGFPPFLGFIGKELKYAGAIAVASEPILVAGAALLANALMLAVAAVVALRPFWQGSVPSDQSPREAPWQMWAGPIILASLGAIFGIYPDLLQVSLINPMVISLTGEVSEAKELKLWAGFNIPLLLSVATFVLGILIYMTHVKLRAMLDRGFNAIPNLDRGWDRFLDGLKGFAKWQTQLVQNGKLSSYLSVTFLTIASGVLLTFVYTGLPAINVDLSDVEWKHASIALLTIAGSILALVTSSRIAGIAALGVVGIGIALIFILFSAPDVAITQLLVETLVVVLVAIVMLRLPSLPKAEFRLGHAALSIAMGVSVTLILVAVVSSPLDLRLTDYFEATSWPEAYGRNIVNVILVDFRALDTFGEIAVVVIAALSAYALLRTTRKGDQK